MLNPCAARIRGIGWGFTPEAFPGTIHSAPTPHRLSRARPAPYSQLGSAQLPEELAEVAAVEVTDEEEGTTELQFTDEGLVQQLQAVVKRAKLEKRYNDWVAGVAESLGPALDAAAGGVEVTEMPVDPYDVLQAVVAQLIRVAGALRVECRGKGTKGMRGWVGAEDLRSNPSGAEEVHGAGGGNGGQRQGQRPPRPEAAPAVPTCRGCRGMAARGFRELD